MLCSHMETDAYTMIFRNPDFTTTDVVAILVVSCSVLVAWIAIMVIECCIMPNRWE